MFSGLITEIGEISQKHAKTVFLERESGFVIRVSWLLKNYFKSSLGDSVSVNGACLTITKKTLFYFEADVSAETMSITTGLDSVGKANLEFSLKMGDKIGGHMVSGHVDGVAKVTEAKKISESKYFLFSTNIKFLPMIQKKGSVALNGVSLTVNSVEERDGFCFFSINLIPYTLEHTNLGMLSSGSLVNLELDSLVKIVDQILLNRDNNKKLEL